MRILATRIAQPLLLPVALLALPLAGCKKDQEEPAAAASQQAAPTGAVEDEAATGMQTAEDWIAANYADMGTVLYAKAEVDLDGDGTPEVLAYVGGPMLCGTGGCNLEVLKRDGAGLTRVSEVSVVQLPVGVLDSKTNGWRDLAVTVAGGGLAQSVMRLPFDGSAYASNPTVPPAVEADSIGKVLIADAPLKPLK